MFTAFRMCTMLLTQTVGRSLPSTTVKESRLESWCFTIECLRDLKPLDIAVSLSTMLLTILSSLAS